MPASSLLPGIYGRSLKFYSKAAPSSVSDLPTLIGEAIPTGAIGVLLQTTASGVISFTFDGSSPSSTVGFQLAPADGPLFIAGPQMRSMKLILATGGTVQIEFFGS